MNLLQATIALFTFLMVTCSTVSAKEIRFLTYNFFQRPVVNENYSDFKGARRRKFCKQLIGGFIQADVIAFQELFGGSKQYHVLECAREVSTFMNCNSYLDDLLTGYLKTG
jgi:hypothetical protein